MKYWITILMLLCCCAQAGTKSLRGGPAVPNAFTLTVTDSPRIIVVGGTTTTTVNDVTTTTTTGATVMHDKQVAAIFLSDLASVSVGWVSSNTGVATVSSSGFVTHVADGTAVITGSTSRWQISTSITFSTDTPVTIVTSTATSSGSGTTVYASPSLANAIDTALDPYLSGSGTEANCKLFSVVPSVYAIDGTTQYYTRNPSLWATGTTFDFTGVSPYNYPDATWAGQYGMNTIHGTMITPRHVLTCNHYHWGNGCVLTFVTGTGTVVTGTITKGANVPGSDIYIGVLGADIDSRIKTYEVLPSGSGTNTNFLQYFKGHAIPNGLTGLVMAQVPGANLPNQGHLKNAWVMRVTLSSSTTYAVATDTTSALRQGFKMPFGYAVNGDSGSPTFFVIDGKLVLVGTFHSPIGAYDASVIGYHDQINAMMTGTGALSTTGTTYQLTDHNMSNWTTQ